MKTITYITSRIELLRKGIIRILKSEPFDPLKELDHPRFHIDKNFDLKAKNSNSSLLFHMYSKENDTLFI